MKTKAEINSKIKQLREWRDNSGIEVESLREQHRQACNLMIMALRFALGYKIGTRYWCLTCARLHKNIKCPYCGNDHLDEAHSMK